MIDYIMKQGRKIKCPVCGVPNAILWKYTNREAIICGEKACQHHTLKLSSKKKRRICTSI